MSLELDFRVERSFSIHTRRKARPQLGLVETISMAGLDRLTVGATSGRGLVSIAHDGRLVGPVLNGLALVGRLHVLAYLSFPLSTLFCSVFLLVECVGQSGDLQVIYFTN